MHQKIVAGTIFKVWPSIRKVEELVELDSQEQEKWNSLRQDSKGIYQQEDAAKHSKHPVGTQRDDSGPSIGDMGLDGFCFAAIDFRSGTPNTPLGLNGMTLGPVLATRVFMGSVFLSKIPDLAQIGRAHV